jgi:hypothetical protein
LEWKIVVQCGAPIGFVVDVSIVWGYKTTNITGGDLVNSGKNQGNINIYTYRRETLGF